MLTKPRIHTKPLRDLTEPGASWGPDVVWFVTEILGGEVDEWQEWLANHMLEVLTYEHAAERLLVGINPEREQATLDELYAEPKVVGGRPIPNGKLRFSKVILLIARQSGKTHFAKHMIMYFAFRQRSEHILHAAQDLNNALSLWEELVREIEFNYPKLKKKVSLIQKRNGAQTIFANNSQTLIQPVGIGPSSGRGKTVDFLFVDELRTQSKYSGIDALEATTTARTNGLVLLASNAGGADAIVLRDYRQSALAQVADSDENVHLQTALFEWSASPMAPLDSVEGMMDANPAIGAGRVALSTIQGYQLSKTPTAFRQEHLCQFSEDIAEDLDPIVDLQEWTKLHADGVKVDDRALAIEVSPVTGRTKFVSAGETTIGAHLEIAPVKEQMTVDEVVDVVESFVAMNDPLAVVLDEKTDAAAYLEPLRQAGIDVATIGPSSLGSAFSTFLSRVDDKKITHDGNPIWENELKTTVTRTFSGGRASFIERYHGEPQALTAAILALWGLERFAIVVPEHIKVAKPKLKGRKSQTVKTEALQARKGAFYG